jgi:hypothetical protein
LVAFNEGSYKEGITWLVLGLLLTLFLFKDGNYKDDITWFVLIGLV